MCARYTLTAEQAKLILASMVRALENKEFRQKLMVWFIKVYPIWDAATPGGFI